MSYRKMTPLFVVLLGFTLFFILGCTTTTNVNVDDLRIIAADAVEVPIGEYTVPYTIENINDYVDEYGLVVEVSAVDQFNNPVDTTQNVFTVVAGRIYTVRIRAIINGETAEELVITITAVALSIQSIVITTPPTKTTYVEGETFDPSGMVVTAIYSDLSSSVVHDISYLTTPLGLSNTTWTITHIASGKTATVSLTIIPLSEAVWTVQFDGNGGQLISGVETQAIHHGESAIAPVYTKKDCIFNGFDVSFDNVTSHLSVTAQWIDTTVGTAGLEYSQNGQTYEVSGYFGTNPIVYVPALHNGLPVTRIGNYAFVNKTTIEELNLPDSILAFGIDPFAGAVNLEAINVSPDNQQFQSIDGVVYDVTGTIMIRCPQGKTGVLTIADGVLALENSAALGCRKLSDIVFPASLIEIGNLALNDTLWLDNQSNGLVYVGQVAFRFLGTMPDNTTIILDADTKSIAAEAFALFDQLVGIQLPNGLLSIGAQAFLGCDGLTEIIIPDSVKSIGDSAFEQSTHLSNLYVSSQLEHLGSQAFRGTAWFDNLADGVVYVSQILYAYKGIMPENTSLQVLAGTKAIGDYAFYQMDGSDHLVSIELPASLQSIGKGAFSGCVGLTMILIPEGVTTIGGLAFYNTIVDIYAEVAAKPLTWDLWWNLSERPVFWNCINDGYAFEYHFDSLGGSPIDSIYTVFLAYLPTPMKVGYDFMGWYEQSDCTGLPVSAPYGSGTKSDITLYAKWQESVYQVTFLIEGWTQIGGGNAIQTVHYGEAITTPPIIEQAGYLFVAWHVSLDGITESINVAPVWAKVLLSTSLMTSDGVWVSANCAFTGCVIEIDYGNGTYVPYIRGSQKLMTTNTTMQARASYRGGEWVAFSPIVIDNIDSSRPSMPLFSYLRTEDGQLLVTIYGGYDRGSGVLRHEYQVGSSTTWIPYTTDTIEITIPNQSVIRARTVDFAENTSPINERFLRIDLLTLTEADQSTNQHYVMTEIESPNGTFSTTTIGLKGTYMVNLHMYEQFVDYTSGSGYHGCGVNAGQIFMEWFGFDYPLSRVNDFVETTDFGKYIEWLTEDTWADPSVFTTPAQLVAGFQGLLNQEYDEYEVIRRSPTSSAEAIAIIESSLAEGYPVAILANDGGHWQIISQSNVIRNEAGEIVSATFLTHDDSGQAFRTWEQLDFFFEDNWKPKVARAMGYTSYVDTIITVRHETPLQTENWTSGWSNVEFFTVENNDYVFLSKADGTVHINNVNADGTIGSLAQSYSWSSGWDNISFYSENGETYLVLFKSSNQLLHIRKMNADGSIGDLTEEMTIPELHSTPLSTLRSVSMDGVSYLEATGISNFNGASSNFIFDLADLGVFGVELSHDFRIAEEAYTQSSFYQAYGKTYVIHTNAETGFVGIYAVTESLSIGELVAEYHWTDGWTNVVPFSIQGQTFLFLSKSGNLALDGFNADEYGITRIHRINEDGSIGVLIDSTYWQPKDAMFLSFGYNVVRFYQNATGDTLLFALRGFDGMMKLFPMKTDGTILADLS